MLRGGSSNCMITIVLTMSKDMIHRYNIMGFLSGFTVVHPGTIVYDNTIHTTLHWAQQMMVQIWHINGLVDYKVVLQACEEVHIGEGTTDCAVLICTKPLICQI